jgi:hypothetical protein
MQTGRILSLYFFLLPLGLLNAQTSSPGSLRFTYYNLQAPTNPIPTGFLIKAKAAGYTHVIIEFIIDPATHEWNAGRYIGNKGKFPMREGLKCCFQKVDSFGLRMIPEFQMGSKWSGFWQFTNNPNIKWELLNYKEKGLAQETACPVFAPDSQGLDLSFRELIIVIRDAFNAAHLTYPMEYLMLGHDETYCDECSKGPKLLVGQSDRDNAWMAKHPATTVCSSVELLIADEIARRVAVTRKIIPSVRVLMFADMFDPGLNGGRFHTSNTIKAPVLQNPEIRNNLILVPWCYERAPIAGKPYDFQVTFDHFINAGFMFVFGNALSDGNGSPTPSRLLQISEFMITAAIPKYRQYIGGFIAFNWDGAWDDRKPPEMQMKCFNGMEYIARLYGAVTRE